MAGRARGLSSNGAGSFTATDEAMKGAAPTYGSCQVCTTCSAVRLNRALSAAQCIARRAASDESIPTTIRSVWLLAGMVWSCLMMATGAGGVMHGTHLHVLRSERPDRLLDVGPESGARFGLPVARVEGLVLWHVVLIQKLHAITAVTGTPRNSASRAAHSSASTLLSDPSTPTTMLAMAQATLN